MVEQLDTEEFAALGQFDTSVQSTNVDAKSYVPPALTKTWFHTGAYFETDEISRHNEFEYFREPELTEEEYLAMLLDDTILPEDIRGHHCHYPHMLSTDEKREACRALKGQMLRSEIYTLDGSSAEGRPYKVTESNYNIDMFQPQHPNRYACYFAHPHQSVEFNYERNFISVNDRRLADPRVVHTLTLSTDYFGNVLESATIAYGRRNIFSDPMLTPKDHAVQLREMITYDRRSYTNRISSTRINRNPMPAEVHTYQLFNMPFLEQSFFTSLYRISTVRGVLKDLGGGAYDLPYEDFEGMGAIESHPYQRLIHHQRLLYRRDDLDGPLPLGKAEGLGIPYETYDKAFDQDLIRKTFVASGRFKSESELSRAMMKLAFVHVEGDVDWWIPTGITFFSPNKNYSAAEELQYAKEHFFQGLRFQDPFYSETNPSEWFVKYDKYDLLLQESGDALGNRVTVGQRNDNPDLPPVVSGQDYRLLTPNLITDANFNLSAIAYDTLGYVVGSALLGKVGENEGDTFDRFETNLPKNTIDEHFRDPISTATELLAGATSRYVYDIYAFQNGRLKGEANPIVMSTITRSIHNASLEPGESPGIMLNIGYNDGFSRTIQNKIYAGPGRLGGTHSAESVVPRRFICSGWTIFNNKAKPIRKYEPFYTAKHEFEFDAKAGVSTILFYDPLERVVAMLFPDNSWSKSTYDPWSEQLWDANDTVLRNPLDDPDVGDYFRQFFEDREFTTWYENRIQGALGKAEQAAAIKTALHADTPTRIFFDCLGSCQGCNQSDCVLTYLGHQFLRVQLNRRLGPNKQPVEEQLSDSTMFDIQGQSRRMVDSLGRTAAVVDYSMMGAKIHQASMESGELWTLQDVENQTCHAWDSRHQYFRTICDALHRPVEVFLSMNGEPEILIEKTVYGESLPNPERLNFRREVVEVYDQSGNAVSSAFDFKGNVLRSVRQLAKEYKRNLDWQGTIDLEPEEYVTTTTYDAANRVIEAILPDQTVSHHFYNELSQIRRIDAGLGAESDQQTIIEDVQYNARNQQIFLKRANGSITVSEYDEFTFRLRKLRTHRPLSRSSDADKRERGREDVQSLQYTYDPIGNVLHIQDTAQQRVFFRNKVVDSSSDYAYDALYRLIHLTGREHIGQAGNAEKHQSDSGNNVNAMARYTEQFEYDKAGNMMELRHHSDDEKSGSWSKKFIYDEPSQLQADRKSNRLTSVQIGTKTEHFKYDGDAGIPGNITSMSTLPVMTWNYQNELSSTSRQAAEKDVVPETTFYRYDTKGKRVRKITETHSSHGKPTKVLKERVYIGIFERFRKYSGDDSVILERETLRLGDDQADFVLVETRTKGEDKGVRQMMRYQVRSLISSASIELGPESELLSYEEYSAYGETTYRTSNSDLEAPKRYRFSGKELDSENGLYYYGARYYAPHVYRWISCDPGGLADGLNLYEFTKANPVSKGDPNGMEATWFNRATGVLKAVGGVMEIAVGAAGVATPTGVTQVLGVVAIAHGLDTAWSGIKQAYTGEDQKTWTEEKVTSFAEDKLHMSKEKAELLGAGVDIAAGIIPEAGIGAARAGVKLLGKAEGLYQGAKSIAKATGSAIIETAKDVSKVAGHVKDVVMSEVRISQLALEGAEHGGVMLLDDLYMMAKEVGKPLTSAMKEAGGKAERAIAKGIAKLEKAAKSFPEHVGNPEKYKEWLKAMAKEVEHHLLPRGTKGWLLKQFKKAGIEDINGFVVTIKQGLHRVGHGHWKKIVNLGLDWNKEWEEWFKMQEAAGKTVTKDMVMKQLGKMMVKYGLVSDWNKWTRYTGTPYK